MDENACAVQSARSHSRHVMPRGTAAAELSMARPSAQTIRRAWLMSHQLHQDLPRPGGKVLPDRARLTMTVSFRGAAMLYQQS